MQQPNLWLPLPMAFSLLCVSRSICVFSLWGCQLFYLVPTLIQCNLNLTLLTTYAKTLLPSQVTLWSSRWKWNSRGHLLSPVQSLYYSTSLKLLILFNILPKTAPLTPARHSVYILHLFLTFVIMPLTICCKNMLHTCFLPQSVKF